MGFSGRLGIFFQRRGILGVLSLFLFIVGGQKEADANQADLGFQIIQSFAEIDTAGMDQNTLVMLDADETLIQPTDAYMINEHTDKAKAFRERVRKQYPVFKEDMDLLSVILLETDRPLIDPGAVECVKSLHDKGAKVIVFTGMNSGQYGRVPRLEVWRHDHMKSLGIELSFSDHDIPFKGFERKPVFYKGVLVTDLGDKGPVLEAFVSHINPAPKAIVMVDDKPQQLASIQKACEKMGIAFKGYLFKGYKQTPWNEPLAQFQADYLVKHKKWLSDDKAIPMMKNEGVLISTSSIKTINETLAMADEKTLVIFDVDDVLLQPQDQILRRAYKKELLKRGQGSGLGEDAFFSTIFSQAKPTPVDSRMPSVVHALQARGVKTLALTHCYPGAFGVIPSMAKWRSDHLKSLGYDFTKSWKNLNFPSFQNFKQVMFKDGILFSTYYEKGQTPDRIDYPKGETLEAFLKTLPSELNPGFTKIIFIDDGMENLDSVRDFCKRAGIAFIGIHYISVHEERLHPLNKERAAFQINILEKEKRWLSDDEAEYLMKASNVAA